MQPLISVIIPNYNESANVRRGVLNDVVRYLRSKSFTWEVIVSDDGSSDDSTKMIESFAHKVKGLRLLKNSHAGKPYALRAGIQAATGKYVLLTDMDQSTPITELDKLLPWTEKGFNVVIGSRGTKRNDATLFRQLASIIFLSIRRAILLPRIKDTQCGFKLVETGLARRIFSDMRVFGRVNNAIGWKVTAYDVELLFLARKKQVPIKEVRVLWRDEDVSVSKNRNFIKESYEMFFEILRVRVNDMLGKYG